MEKSFLTYAIEKLNLKKKDIRTYSPLALAYIGDGVYDLIIRTMVINKGNSQVNAMHKSTSKIVKARSQAIAVQSLLSELTEKELAVYKRGRNAKSGTMAKNALIKDYKSATGYEALIGYLYLNQEFERILELVTLGLRELGE